MWNHCLPRLMCAAFLFFACIVPAQGAGPETIEEAPLPACDSLVDRYVFMMAELSGSPSDPASAGWVLDEAGLYCEPFANAPVPLTLRGQRVNLTQQGIREGQRWYKARYTDSAGVRQTGYLKGESVALLSDFNPCHNQRCLRLYYAIEFPDTLVLKTAVPDPTLGCDLGSRAMKSLRIASPHGIGDVRTTFFCNVDKKSLHLVEVRTGEGCGGTTRTLLVLADWASGEMSVVFDEMGHGGDDDYRVLAVYASRDGWPREYKYLPEYAGGESGRVPCPDKAYQQNKYVHIREESGEGLVDANGESVLDEHGMIRSRVVLRKEGWYEITGNTLRPVLPR